MKSLLIIIVLILPVFCSGQELTSENFQEYIEGTWVYSGFCDEEWEEKSWMCVDTNKIDSSGIVLSTRVCEGMEDPMVTKSKWTRFDSENMVIYGSYIDFLFGTGWIEEQVVYTVFKFLEDEMWLEAEAFTEGSDEPQTLRVIYRRI